LNCNYDGFATLVSPPMGVSGSISDWSRGCAREREPTNEKAALTLRSDQDASQKLKTKKLL